MVWISLEHKSCKIKIVELKIVNEFESKTWGDDKHSLYDDVNANLDGTNRTSLEEL